MEDGSPPHPDGRHMTMDDRRLKQLMDQFNLDLMAEELEHDCWVVLVWMVGRAEGGPPEAGHGPYPSAFAALEKADRLRVEMQNAPGREAFLSGYTPTISVIPVFGDEEDTA